MTVKHCKCTNATFKYKRKENLFSPDEGGLFFEDHSGHDIVRTENEV